MLNYIWLTLVLLAVLIGGFTGRIEAVTNGAFMAAKDAVMIIALPLAGLMALWLGFLRLAELSGLVQMIARGLQPVMRRLFPEVPVEHPAMGAMLLNMAANMLGLGNAATPLGLRAMKHLESLNPHPGTATNAMCTFLAINTSSIQLVPATAVSFLAAAGSKEPTAIIGTAFLATSCATMAALTAVKLLQKLPMFQVPPEAYQTGAQAVVVEQEKEIVLPNPAPLTTPGRWALRAFIGAFALLLVMLVFPTLFPHGQVLHFGAFDWTLQFPQLPAELGKQTGFARVLGTVSLLAVPLILGFFTLYAALRGVKVYEEFVEGAKEGFHTAVRIIPFLVAILVAVRMFREAGGIDIVAAILSPVLSPLGFPVDLLPMTLVRPLSGGATTGLFGELVTKLGPDSPITRTAATIFGSTETTFYVLAVYFGAVAVKRQRHAIAVGLVADGAGVIASVIICQLYFGNVLHPRWPTAGEMAAGAVALVLGVGIWLVCKAMKRRTAQRHV